MTLGERLGALREMAGISASESARLAGISRGYPALIEAGERPDPGGQILAALAEVYGVPIEYLVRGGVSPLPDAVQAAVASARERLVAPRPENDSALSPEVA